MGTLIAMSSLVARGSVGLRAIAPAVEAAGHAAVLLPTTLLSNHPKHPHCAGGPVAPDALQSMIGALEANGWLERADAVLTGYLPTAEHAAVAEDLIARVRARQPRAVIVCDPVLGDDPGGLFLPQPVAEAVRSRLLPLAGYIKPNRFELAFLSGRPVSSPAEAVAAARALPVPVVLASSIPASGADLANVIVTPDAAAMLKVKRASGVPHGTGDYLAARFAARLIEGLAPMASAASAVADVDRLVAASSGRDELAVWQADATISLPLHALDPA